MLKYVKLRFFDIKNIFRIYQNCKVEFNNHLKKVIKIYSHQFCKVLTAAYTKGV